MVEELRKRRAEAVKALKRVDMFSPLARVDCQEAEAKIKIIDRELRRYVESGNRGRRYCSGV